MNCPDIERLIDLSGDPTLSVEAAAHIAECSRCRAAAHLIAEARAAYDPVMAVPEDLIEASVDAAASLMVVKPPVEFATPAAWEILSTALLGCLTFVAVGLGTGAFGGEAAASLVMLLVSAGAGPALTELWLRRPKEEST